MATGTGKTRTAVSLVDVLMAHRWVTNISAKFIIMYSLRGNFEESFNAVIVCEVTFFQSLIVFIGEGRHIVLQVKKVIGVMPDIALGCGGQSNQNGIKILKNSTVLLEDTPMCLVNDDNVKMSRREQFLR